MVPKVSVVAAAVLLVGSTPVLADGATVNVGLWDRGGMVMEHMQDMPHMGMGMPMTRMPMAMMGIATDQVQVPGGEVTFVVSNQSRELSHEMVVAPAADPEAPLPYDEVEMTVDEEAAGALGEVEELEPGGEGKVTLSLQPGTYVLFCNVPGHYAAGMWAVLTVTG
jgi:uncharacterized cupredoxin-like copper-binding protein